MKYYCLSACLVFSLLLYTFAYGQRSQKAITFTPQLLCIDNNEACSIADINRDGLPDVVAGRLWYPAPDFVHGRCGPLPCIRQTMPKTTGNISGMSMEMVGWMWWQQGGMKTRIQWFQNPGEEGLMKGLTWKAHTLADTRVPNGEAGFMHDIDGDGTPEYIMNSYFKGNPFSIWRFGKHAKGSPILLGTLIGQHNSHGVGFGDLNNDGRTDVLFDNGWYEQPATEKWSGDWTLHQDWNLEGGSCPMQVVDLNEDGRNDIIWGRGHDYGLYWFEQGKPIGDSTTWTRHLIDSTWSQIHALAWEDMDGDGQEELLTGKRIWAHSGKDPGSDDPAFMFLYKWDSENQTFNRQVIAEGKIGTGLFIRAGDLNADGKKDILGSWKDGHLYFMAELA